MTLEQWIAWAPVLERIYQDELGRSCFSDPQAFVNWSYHWREHDSTADTIRQHIRQSPEWQARHGSPPPPPPPPDRPGHPGKPETPPPVSPLLPGGGGLVEHASSRVVRPRLTRGQMAAFLPSTPGPFIFPGYGTRGIRLTTERDGQVHPLGMAYWPMVNQHAGQPHLYVCLSLDGQLRILQVDKATYQVNRVNDLPIQGTGEGCYFSGLDPHILYAPQGDRLRFFDILTRQSGDAAAAPGPIRQPHSSTDGQRHSFTLGQGAAVAMNGDVRRYSPNGAYDECQIDKSGEWLLSKETGPDGPHGNRIIHIPSDREWFIQKSTGGVGHSDMGYGYVIGEDNVTEPGGVFRRFDFTPSPRDGGVMYATDWTSMTRYVSHCNAKPGGPQSQLALYSSSHDGDAPRANELVVAPLDGSQQCRVLCPNLNDLNANDPHGADNRYWRKTRAAIDPPGQFALFTGNCGTERVDAFLVQVT